MSDHHAADASSPDTPPRPRPPTTEERHTAGVRLVASGVYMEALGKAAKRGRLPNPEQAAERLHLGFAHPGLGPDFKRRFLARLQELLGEG